MKKLILVCLISVSILTLGTVNGFADSVEGTLNKMVKALGGKENLEKITNYKFSGTFDLKTMNIQGDYERFQKEPNKIRINIKAGFGTMTQAFDGNTAWMSPPQGQGPQKMPEKQGKEFSSQAIGNNAYLNPAKYGMTYVYKGKKDNWIVLEQTASNGFKKKLYIDSKTYLLHKTVSMVTNQAGAETKSTAVVSEYKNTGGVMVPRKVEIIQNEKTFVTFTITKVEQNLALDDSMFTFPEKKQ